MYPLKGFETSSDLFKLSNDDGYHQSEESLFASFKRKEYQLQMNPFSSPYGTLNEDHAFYYSDLLDIINHERDLSRRRHRFKVILHGSKTKQTRPLFQHNEAPTTWTSSLRMTMRRYAMMGFAPRGLDENFQMMVELGFVNHLLMFMTHSYRYLYEKKKFKHLNLPVAPENVDCFMYEKKDFLDEHAHYPVYSAELLNFILLTSDEKTFKAIIERYFTEEQNGPNSSKMINDGRHVVMNGVGVLYKVLKYGVVTQRDLVTGIIRTIIDRCATLGLDVPNFILLNETYPLNEAILQFIKDYQNPEKMWNEFNEEGFYQSDIFPSMDAEYNEDGANNARRWLISSLKKASKTMLTLTLTAKRKGLRKRMFTQAMLFELLDLIDNFPHVDNFMTLFSSVRTFLINLFSLFLYDEEKLDQDGNIEQPFEVDYQLLEELTTFPIERFCKMLTRIDFDLFYSVSNIKKLMTECEKNDRGLEDRLSTALQNIIAEESSLVCVLSWISHNPILASKIANFENGILIDMLINSTVIEKQKSDNTNMRGYDSEITNRSNVVCIVDDYGKVFHITIPRFASSYIILGNILQAVPELNGKINDDGQFYIRYYVSFIGSKRSINDFDVQLRDYNQAIVGYKNTFVILSDILEENYPTPETIRSERVIIASNIAEMAIRLNNKHLAEKYIVYALKLDPNHEKSKKRLETIKKL